MGWELLRGSARIQSVRGRSAFFSPVNSVEPFPCVARKGTLLEGRSLADQASPGLSLARVKEDMNLGRCGAPPGVQRGHSRSEQTNLVLTSQELLSHFCPRERTLLGRQIICTQGKESVAVSFREAQRRQTPQEWAFRISVSEFLGQFSPCRGWNAVTIS